MDTASTITSSPAGAQLYSMRWIVAAVVLAANTMDLLDATIVNVACPSLFTANSAEVPARSSG